MFNKARPSRDAFAFSLGGISAITSFVAARAVADDRINDVHDERLRGWQEDQPETGRELETLWGRFWLDRHRRRAA